MVQLKRKPFVHLKFERKYLQYTTFFIQRLSDFMNKIWNWAVRSLLTNQA